MERKWGRGDPRAPERPLALEGRFHRGGSTGSGGSPETASEGPEDGDVSDP